MFKKLIFIAIVFFTIVSCEKSFDPGATNAVGVAGEWWSNVYEAGSPWYSKPAKIMTYNDAANKDSIWVDDLGNLYNFKVKAKFDAKTLTFATTNAADEYYDPAHPTSAPLTVTITDGKVMPKAAKSATGVVTDSIYFKVEFSDAAGTVYEIKGTGRTGWAEDDH